MDYKSHDFYSDIFKGQAGERGRYRGNKFWCMLFIENILDDKIWPFLPDKFHEVIFIIIKRVACSKFSVRYQMNGSMFMLYWTLKDIWTRSYETGLPLHFMSC